MRELKAIQRRYFRDDFEVADAIDKSKGNAILTETVSNAETLFTHDGQLLIERSSSGTNQIVKVGDELLKIKLEKI
jgi:hypothetical protein